MIAVGAIIGGVTNSLAIKMLFRPYEAKYIGKYKVPFTPGLIPKRRNELASQLGKMVVDHLLTPEGLRKKLHNPQFKMQMENWAKTEADKLFESKVTARDIFNQSGLALSEEDMQKKLEDWIENRYDHVMSEQRSKPIQNVLSEQMIEKGDRAVESLSKQILMKFEAFISSAEGKRKIGQITDNYLGNQGFFGNMISSFLGNEGLADKIQPVLSGYLRSDEAQIWVNQWLEKEWNELLENRVQWYEDKIGSEAIKKALGKVAIQSLPLGEWLDRPLAEWVNPFRSKISYQFIPYMVSKVVDYLANRIESMMKQLHLAEIVEQEVESFSVERLEEMVLDISRREFKMITFLGALLGGVIGLFQGFFVTFFG